MTEWLILSGILIVILLVITYIQDRQIIDLKEDVELYFKEVQNEMAQKHETGQRFWETQEKLNALHVEFAKLESEKYNDKRLIKDLNYKLEVQKEIIARQKIICECFADKLLQNGISVTLKEVESFNTMQWGAREYQYFMNKQNMQGRGFFGSNRSNRLK